MVERIAWLMAVLVVGGAAFFGGQQLGRQAGLQARTQAQQQFFAERGGGQAGAGPMQGAMGGGGAPGAAGGQPVMGTVARVEGEQVVLTTADGAEVTLTLADGGTVRRQVAGRLADLAVGEQLVVVGTLDGDTLTASSVQIGGGFGRGGGAPPAP